MASIDNNVVFYLDGSTIEDKSLMKHAIIINNNLIPNSIEQGKFDASYSEGGCSYSNTDNVFSFGLKPFTIDFWVNKPDEGNYDDFLFSYNDSNPIVNGYSIGYLAGKIAFKQWTAMNSYLNLSFTIKENEWNHIAFVGDGTNIYAYCNGVFQSKLKQKELKANALAFKPQGHYYIDELRVSNVARWNTDFTPPKTPLGYSPIINATVLEKNVTITIEDKYECIDKVEVFVNNVLSKTYTENFNTLTYAIDESLLGIGLNNIKIVVAYDGTDKIEKVIDYNVNIDTLPSNSSLNKIVEVVELLSNTNQIEYNNLKNNLTEKGVECSDTDKMSSLIDKVKDISIGKKWASGTYSDLTSMEQGNSQQIHNITLNLDFIPSNIIISFLAYNSFSNNGSRLNVSSLRNYSYETSMNFINNVIGDFFINNVTSKGFDLVIDKRNSVNYYFNMYDVTWVAYE